MSEDRHIKIPEPIQIFKDPTPSEITMGFLQMQTLWILSKKEMHGYGIMKELSKLKSTKITQGTIYPVIKKLKNGKYIKSKKSGRTVIYSLTEKGHAAMEIVCENFSKTFFGIFRDYACRKCVKRGIEYD